MLVYLITFTISIAFIITGLKIKNKFFRITTILIGLVLPCILAGARNIEIGTDTKGYIHNLYDLSLESNSIGDFFALAYKWYVQKDYLYLIITYCIGKNKLGFGFLLFVYEILIIFPIFYSFKKLEFNKKEILIGLIFFYFILYNVTLNMLRQSLSIAFCTLSFSFYVNYNLNKRKRDLIITYLLLIVAYGFHSTSIIMLAVMLLYRFYNTSCFKEKNKTIISFLIMICTVFFVIFHREILTFIATSGIYRLASYYLDHYSIKDFSFYQTFINLFIVFIIISNKNSIKENGFSFKFLLTISVLNFIISSGLGYFILYSQRIMLYTQYILLFCFAPKILSKSNKMQYLYIYNFLVIISWLLYIGVMNVNETVPYLLFNQ